MYLAVYGTLKRNFGNNILMGESEYLGNIELPKEDFAMFDGGVPVVVPIEGHYNTLCELYEFDTRCLDSVDRLEGHPHAYTRTILKFDDVIIDDELKKELDSDIFSVYLYKHYLDKFKQLGKDRHISKYEGGIYRGF